MDAKDVIVYLNSFPIFTFKIKETTDTCNVLEKWIADNLSRINRVIRFTCIDSLQPIFQIPTTENYRHPIVDYTENGNPHYRILLNVNLTLPKLLLVKLETMMNKYNDDLIE